MSDELRQAAERLRMIANGVEMSVAYEGDVDCFATDKDIVADAYLAEHPADDGEAVTGDLLKSLGWVYHASLHQWASGDYGKKLRVLWWPNIGSRIGTWHIEVSDTMSPPIPNCDTRGQLRGLLSALGIEVKS